ncbi:MAG: hypothetical protein CEO21_322 [Microgenomates group bacterium Gr01-1014_80]|nr:MAG: hypothetical protein CEO21_322 [Microgenomates group bacterium Gr01-1014_80]
MNKIKLLIVGLVIINVILFTVVYLNRDREAGTAPTPQPNSVQYLNVVSTSPAFNLLSEISSGTPIVINFDMELDPSAVVIQTHPIVETSILVTGYNLTIKPKTYWPTDQEIEVKLLITRGINGSQMMNPYKFVIKSPKPTF